MHFEYNVERKFHDLRDVNLKNYFIKDASGKLVKGKTLTNGKGFGMNTHVGIVGAIKDGVPLVFHNITGSVFSDPYNKLKNGGKIVWIKRK